MADPLVTLCLRGMVWMINDRSARCFIDTGTRVVVRRSQWALAIFFFIDCFLLAIISSGGNM